MGMAGPTHHRVEERPERLEEPLVVQQGVDGAEVAGQSQAAVGQDRLPQRQLRVYRSQRGGSNLLCKGVGAIVPTSGPDREHRRGGKAQVSAFFRAYFFRSK